MRRIVSIAGDTHTHRAFINYTTSPVKTDSIIAILGRIFPYGYFPPFYWPDGQNDINMREITQKKTMTGSRSNLFRDPTVFVQIILFWIFSLQKCWPSPKLNKTRIPNRSFGIYRQEPITQVDTRSFHSNGPLWVFPISVLITTIWPKKRQYSRKSGSNSFVFVVLICDLVKNNRRYMTFSPFTLLFSYLLLLF